MTYTNRFTSNPESERRFEELAAKAREESEARRKKDAEDKERISASSKAASEREAGERRAQAAKDIDEQIRKNFFAGNPGATEADYERLKGQLKDQQMLSASQTESVYDRIRREAAERNQPRRSLREVFGSQETAEV